MSTASCRCGATWSGHRPEHCTICHQTFSGTQPGDMHRIGPHWPPGQRRCRTVAEMEELGMTRNSRGYWTTGRADQRWAAQPQSDEQPVAVSSAHPDLERPSNPERQDAGVQP